MKRKTIKYTSSLIILIVFLIGAFVFDKARFNNGKLHVVICDVGQGDAIYIRTPSGKDILVDGGPSDKVLECLSNNMPFWDKTIELMLVSHPHADHITGLISVLDRYSLIYYATENVAISGILPKKLQDKLAVKNITANYLKYGDRIVISDQTTIETFWPDENSLRKYAIASKSANFNIDKNGFSLVQVLSFGDFKLLLTGDADTGILNKIASEIGDVDVLKVSHHGSKTGTNKELLDSITPEIAVISAGEENRYGHPAKQVLDYLEDAGVKILRTDKLGDIKITTDGKSYKIN